MDVSSSVDSPLQSQILESDKTMAATKNWFIVQGESRRGPFSASVVKRFPTEGDCRVTLSIFKNYSLSYLAFKFILGMTAFLAFASHSNCVLALQPEISANSSKRYSSPDKKAQSISLLEVKGLYKAAYARSSSPQEVQDSIQQMLADAKEILIAASQDAPPIPVCYTMLDEAARIAVKQGSYQVNWEAICLMEDNYDFEDFWKRVEKFTQTFLRKADTPRQFEELHGIAADLVERSLRGKRFNEAERFTGKLASLAKKLKRSEADHYTKLRERFRTLNRIQETGERARKALIDSPSDSEANLAVGNQEFFVNDKLEEAIKYWKKSNAPSYRKLAELEMKRIASPDDSSLTELMRLWTSVSRNLKTVQQEKAGFRALELCRILLDDSSLSQSQRQSISLHSKSLERHLGPLLLAENARQKLEVVDAGEATAETELGNEPVPRKLGEDLGNGLFEFNGHFYLVIKQPFQFGKAMARAKELGGTLVILDSDAEFEFLQSLVSRKFCWLGASETKKNSEAFLWQDNSGRRVAEHWWGENEPKADHGGRRVAFDSNTRRLVSRNRYKRCHLLVEWHNRQVAYAAVQSVLNDIEKSKADKKTPVK